MSINPADHPIAVYQSLAGFHSDPESSVREAGRSNALIEEFQKRYGKPPTHVARAPGRVNLIGEHIDYCLFGVLPAAVERDILIACAPADGPDTGETIVGNLDGNYNNDLLKPSVSADGHWGLPIDKSKLHWSSYIKAAYLGVLSHLFSTGEHTLPKNAFLLVTGSVPLGGGLSSSAALVVASTLAFVAVNEKVASITQGQLVELCMENERRVGVNSGGMDQAASVFSSPASALYITFYPKLHASPVPLPQTTAPVVYVIANTLKQANKQETSKIHYNLRVVETLVAARILGNGLGVAIAPDEKVRLREVLARWINEDKASLSDDVAAQNLQSGIERILPEVDRILGAEDGERGFTLEAMITATGMTREDFEKVYLDGPEVEATHFHLYKRTKHVFTEALRVLKFRETSLHGGQIAAQRLPHPTTMQALGRQMPQADITDDSSQRRLGQLMNESHESCDQLFDCSSPELNQLTAIARDSGALGSRLTGAGWGGCCVSLVPEAQVEAFIQAIRERYPPYQQLSGAQLDAAIFATKPGSGAGIYDVGKL